MTLRWQQAEGRRHALDVDPNGPTAPGVEFRALCGSTVTPQREDFQKWLDPTCWDCDHVWREIQHFPANEIPLVSS